MTVGWDGRGLPPAAQARMQRGAEGGPGASLFGISGQAALEACGFDVVGEVMGCIVQQMGWSGYGGCGMQPMAGGYLSYQPTVVLSSGAGAGWRGFRPFVDSLYHGFDTAILRMLLECRDLRGDGVVGVTVERRRLEGMTEFIAYGTAVRSQGKQRPKSLFSTMLPAHDVAKLLHGGWVPAAISIGISTGVRHDDYNTRRAGSMFNSYNTEVPGYTELVTAVRADARRQFAKRTSAFGADGAIMSGMWLDIWEIEPGEGHSDHVASCMVQGTAVARFHKGALAPTSSLKILPLSDSHVLPGSKR